MDTITHFADSRITYGGTFLLTGRWRGQDVILTPSAAPEVAQLGLHGGQNAGEYTAFPASYENMLIWEARLAPRRCLQALNQAGHGWGFGAGNRIVVSQKDVPLLRDPTTFGGWDGIFQAMRQTSAPFWFIQQSIVRELIPDGVDAERYPGIGHTGGYGPRELLRAGLFAFASLGGYCNYGLSIGADADHAIVVGHDEKMLAESLALNKLAMAESSAYTKFTVDVSQLFNFPVTLDGSQAASVQAAFTGRRFLVPNVLPDGEGLEFEFTEEEALRLARKYWRAAAVHKELYDHAQAVRNGRPFDYELSLDETPQATPPRELLFYLVLLQEVLGLPPRGVASAGPNLGYFKRHDYEGDLQALWRQTNACTSILHHFGAMLSAHSADGVHWRTGKGLGVDQVLESASGGLLELKVADVYQELLWEILEASPEPQEREVFQEAWAKTYESVRRLAQLYHGTMASCSPQEARDLLETESGQQRLAAQYGVESLHLAQAVIGYGLPLFRLAADLLGQADPARPRAADEFFRRFMFVPYRSVRPHLFAAMTHDGWQRLAQGVAEATWVRTRAMHWTA